MTVGDHVDIHGPIIIYIPITIKRKFQYTWVHKSGHNATYALLINCLSEKRRGKTSLMSARVDVCRLRRQACICCVMPDRIYSRFAWSRTSVWLWLRERPPA